MKTPYNYTKNLKQNLITEKMIADAIDSLLARSQRQHNAYQKSLKRSTWQGYGKYARKSITTNKEKYIYYTTLIEHILFGWRTPDYIGKYDMGYPQKIIYDTENDYYTINQNNIIDSGRYRDGNHNRYVSYVKVEDPTKPRKYIYKYCWETSIKTLRCPCPPTDVENTNLPIKEKPLPKISNTPLSEYVSVDFCEKVSDMINYNQPTFAKE